MEQVPSTKESAKNQLFDELTKSSVNVLRVRALCRDYLGIIATTGLRIRIWTLLLLGSNYQINSIGEDDIAMPQEPCDEQHVLEADVRRTRSEVEDFRSTTWRRAVHSLLQHFCVSHSIQYKQGMNEVLAPFLYIHPPPNGNALPYALYEAFLFRYLERHLCVDDSSFLFKAFRLFHVLLLYHDPQLALHLKDQDFPPELYTPQWFLTLYSRTLPLQQTLRLWDMIIAVDDPAFTFFIGLCLIRRKRLLYLICTLVMCIQTKDGVSLILEETLLRAQADTIPELIQELGFHGEEDIDSVMADAVVLYKKTPRCLCRNLRLCCVSTTQLTPIPISRAIKDSSVKDGNVNQNKEKSSDQEKIEDNVKGRVLKDEVKVKGKSNDESTAIAYQDEVMAVQATRGCFMLHVKELLTSILSDMTDESQSQKEEMTIDRLRYQDIDGDNDEKCEVGSPTSIVISSDKKAEDSDGIIQKKSIDKNCLFTNGCNDIGRRRSGSAVGGGIEIGGVWGGVQGKGAGSCLDQFVLIDIRSVTENDLSGGGLLSCAIRLDPEFLDKPDLFNVWMQHFDGTRGCNICIIDLPPVATTGLSLWRRLLLGEGDGVSGNSAYLSGLLGNGKGKHISSDSAGFTDPQSIHAIAEKAAMADDLVRPAVRLALALQRHAFANVCVLEGGFPTLVEQLMILTGSVEPIILNHDTEKWDKFLISSGRVSASSGKSSDNCAHRNTNSPVSGVNTPVSSHKDESVIDVSISETKNNCGSAAALSSAAVAAKKIKDELSELEVAQMAYQVAVRLGHKNMENMLLDRVNEALKKEENSKKKDRQR